ncbi:hypothetical protein DFH27DRAFT_578709, partial [Peziza echinospora]
MMSIINLAATMILPQYESVFLVKYDLSQDYEWLADKSLIELLNARMVGAVGSFHLDSDSQDDPQTPPLDGKTALTGCGEGVGARKSWWPLEKKRIAYSGILMAFTLFPLLINYLLTSFEGKESTKSQRIYILLWLSVPTPVCLLLFVGIAFEKRLSKNMSANMGYVYVLGILGAVYLAGAGYYTVIQMIKEFGVCQV